MIKKKKLTRKKLKIMDKQKYGKLIMKTFQKMKLIKKN